MTHAERPVPQWQRELEGLPPKPKRPEAVQEQAADPDVRDRIERAYRADGSIEAISRHTGRSPEVVRLIVKTAGVLRTRDASSRSGKLADTEKAMRAKISRAPAGTRLPPQADLAEELGVTRSTMQKALTRIRRDGLVRYIPGRGLIVADPAHASASTVTVIADGAQQIWLTGSTDVRIATARRTVLERIATGRYPEGSCLPHRGDLRRHLAVSHKILPRALASLIAAGLLSTQSKTGTVVQPGAQHRATIILAEQPDTTTSPPDSPRDDPDSTPSSPQQAAHRTPAMS